MTNNPPLDLSSQCLYVKINILGTNTIHVLLYKLSSFLIPFNRQIYFRKWWISLKVTSSTSELPHGIFHLQIFECRFKFNKGITMLYSPVRAWSVDKVVTGCKYINMQDTILRPQQWHERHMHGFFSPLQVTGPRWAYDEQLGGHQEEYLHKQMNPLLTETEIPQVWVPMQMSFSQRFMSCTNGLWQWSHTQAGTLWREPKWLQGQSL